MNVRGPEKRGVSNAFGRPVARHRGAIIGLRSAGCLGHHLLRSLIVARHPRKAASVGFAGRPARRSPVGGRRLPVLRCEPGLALAEQQPHLAEQLLGGRLRALERLDPLETLDDLACLVHVPEATPRGRAGVCRSVPRAARTRQHIRADRRAEARRRRQGRSASVTQLHWKIGRRAPSTIPKTSRRQRRRRRRSARLGTVIPPRARGTTVLTCGRGRRPRSASSRVATSSSRDPSSSVSTSARRTASSARAPARRRRAAREAR